MASNQTSINNAAAAGQSDDSPENNQVGTTIPAATTSERRASFRKRRLSFPRHHIGGDDEEEAASPASPASPAAATTYSPASGEAAAAAATTEMAQPPAQFLPSTNAAAAAAARDPYGYEPAGGMTTTLTAPFCKEDKAHTFRKRRLSLTLTKSHDEEDDEKNNSEEAAAGDSTAEPAQKRRRSSSATSAGSAAAAMLKTRILHSAELLGRREPPPMLKTRILHSAELLGGHEPPPSPAVHSESVLYQKGTTLPTAASNNNGSLLALPGMAGGAESSNMDTSNNSGARRHSLLLQPKWKRRMHLTDETKLPFSKSIVGTFSCHGVEPIYDSDYNHENDDDDDESDDDDWNPPQNAQTITSNQNKDDDHHAENVNGDTANVNNRGKELHLPEPPADDDNTAAAAATTTTTTAAPPVSVPDKVKPTMAAKINQDRGGIAFPYGNSRHTALFSVYDGHGQGGELVSQFALAEIQRRLEKHAQFQTNIQTALTETFIAVDADLRREPLIEPNYAGTTACVALLRDKELFLANAGDSRAVLARRRKRPKKSDEKDNHNNENESLWSAIDLTVDQNPDSPGENERILSMGGFVSPPPGPGLSARVWLDPHWSQIGLAMARSIGDHAVAPVGVICTPVVTQHTIKVKNDDDDDDDDGEYDDFMILASDGVWEFIDSQTAVDVVGKHLKLRNCATRACQALIEAAAARWHGEEGEYRDDITAIVVRIPELLKQQQMTSTTTTAPSLNGNTDKSTAPAATT